MIQSPVDLVRKHLTRVIESGCAVGYGPRDSAMWMSSLDTRTGRYPKDDTRPPHIPKRCYRWIDAPRGCSLYWDQPLIAAAHALAEVTRDDFFSEAADDYVRDYLATCTAGNGIILWGNHYYYDAFEDAVMWFKGSLPPEPTDPASHIGDYHEMRPIMPAWDALERVDARLTERAIMVASREHMHDPETGLFNRHADRRRGCAFLEAGGILVESLAWLDGLLRSQERYRELDAIERAHSIADYSFEHRGAKTGLLINNPTETRWDSYTCTSEVGLWAGCMWRAGQWGATPSWISLAREAMDAWLRYAWDDRAENYYGRLAVKDGSPILGPTATPYEPGDYCDLWRPQFPAHDYPMPLAEACLGLYRHSAEPHYLLACERWAGVIERSLPARKDAPVPGGYAEHYGRCLHFVLGLAHTTHEARYRALAQKIADEAVDVLWAGDMFRGHPGEDRCDAVDGVGFLALALMWLEEGFEPWDMGLGW